MKCIMNLLLDTFGKGFKFKSKGCVALFPLSLHTQQAHVPEEAYPRRARHVKIFIFFSLFLPLIFTEAGGTDDFSFLTWHRHHQKSRQTSALVLVLLKAVNEVIKEKTRQAASLVAVGQL